MGLGEHQSILNCILKIRLLTDYQEYQQDLLLQPDSNWSFEPERGVTLKNPKISDSGEYGCVGKMNNSVNYEYFSIYVLGSKSQLAKR